MTQTSMLLVDLNMSDQELAKSITSFCSNFGNVNSVKIHRRSKPFALVEMATHSDARKLAAKYGRPPIENGVLIYLGHEEEAR